MLHRRSAGAEPAFGFRAADASQQAALEQRFAVDLEPAHLREWMRDLSARPARMRTHTAKPCRVRRDARSAPKDVAAQWRRSPSEARDSRLKSANNLDGRARLLATCVPLAQHFLSNVSILFHFGPARQRLRERWRDPILVAAEQGIARCPARNRSSRSVRTASRLILGTDSRPRSRRRGPNSASVSATLVAPLCLSRTLLSPVSVSD